MKYFINYELIILGEKIAKKKAIFEKNSKH